jgi:hypothetical protein
MIELHSWEQQDEFIINLFQQKTQGFFLDIACLHPFIGSNSYSLEKFYNWQGIGFDILDIEAQYQWSQHRTSKFVQMDVTSTEFRDYIKQTIPCDFVVDYISLDVDAITTNYTLEVLRLLIEAGINFKAMTFEHESYFRGDDIRQPSRELLRSLGYVTLFDNVTLPNARAYAQADPVNGFEDWWIHPKYFDSRVLDAGRVSLPYPQCVESIRSTLNNQYTATHKCCPAFESEYELFGHGGLVPEHM